MLVALLTAPIAAAPAVVPALAVAAPPTAGEYFRRGVQLYRETDYAGALVEFQRAYDVDPKHQVLYNIAQCHYQLQDYASALRTYQRYLDEGKNEIAPKRRREVEDEIVTLNKRVAMLSIETSEPGAVVTIDDVGVGTTPFEPLMVSAGRRRISATIPGRAPATQVIDIAGGDKQTVRLDIPPAAAPAGPSGEPPPPPPPPAEPSPVPMIVAWSATGALAVGAVITGVVALGASSDLEDELAAFPGDSGAIADAQDSAFAFGLATDILIGTSVVAAGVATYFTVDFVLSSPEAPAEEPEGDDAAARLLVRPGGVTIDGTF